MTARGPVAGLLALACFAGAARSAPGPRLPETQPAWTEAHLKGPMSADETRAFMKRLAEFVFENHLKRDPNSPQRGMIYEHFDVTRKGRFDQWVQGEALDTMHDGAWFAAAMVNAFRATGDEYYRGFLTNWQLPFYLKMLNHSDKLFTAGRNDARPGAPPWEKQWGFQEGEKGFVPYYWDDGGSVSLERRLDKNPLGIRPCVDFLKDKPNPNYLLDGYSLGMSNHLAQDIGVMVQLAWLLAKDSLDPAGRKLAGELAEAARNLHENRLRHHGPIPMCAAPAGLAGGDAAVLRHAGDPDDRRLWQPDNHYTRALVDFRPGQQMPFCSFADGLQYLWYSGLAATGGRLPRPLAFKIIYDAYTEPMMYRYYRDDAPVPPGVNKSDANPLYAVDGKPADYASDRKGHYGRPWPVGCRMGPQNMVCAGWALQALRAYPGIWEERYRRDFSDDLRVYIVDPPGGVPPLEARLDLGGASLALVSTPQDLRVSGLCKGEPPVIRLFARPDGKGACAAVTAAPGKGISAVNDRGEGLIVRGGFRDKGDRPASAEQDTAFWFHLPYTVVKGQKPWANGVEHGRMSIQVGDKTRNLYLASSEQRVIAGLERELGCGLRTWQALFDQIGYLPVAVGWKDHWGRFSDSGGYAHLISAGSQWLLYLDGKSDWQVHRYTAVDKAKPQARRAG